MTMTRTTGVRRRMVPMAVLAVLVAGCGTQRAGQDAGVAAPSRTAATPGTPTTTPSTPTDFPCPGESPSPTPRTTTHSPDPTAAPTDHYAENHGFRVPFSLHGQSRCDGLAAVKRIKGALEPLRERGDFHEESVRSALTALGYPAGGMELYQDGAGVGFLVDARDSPLLCVEGTMSHVATKADAFGGYPDHTGCDVPSGGH